MPSGRDIHTTSPYVPPSLSADILSRMRAPPEPKESGEEDEESSSDESTKERSEVPGAFPGRPVTNANEGNYY